ncbi:hypothetical protein [Leifsonia sp. P73]|uniref:hypothetical protein n=1 Tax=Leifsonia sp. P73 TaxID=3423959 RepID=UPI003DA60596
MSEGPIKQWRDSWKPPTVSTRDSQRVCGARTITTTFCGRKPQRGHITTNWDDVTCADCHAAKRADS